MLLLLACNKVDPAPADLDGLAHFVWQKYDAGTDEEMAEAIVNLDAAIAAHSAEALGDEAGYLEAWFDVGLSDITAEEAALVLPGDERDVSLTRGFLVVNPLPCTMEQAERFTLALDQMALYPDAYLTYDRRYTTDFKAYDARKTPFLEWSVDLTATTAGFEYRELLDGGIRHVPALDDTQSPWGWFTVNRTWLTEPACFGDDCDNPDAHFDQDFQLEIQYERTPGTIVHVFAIWRQAEYFGMDQDNDGLLGLQIDGLVDWDEDTAALCKAEG